MAAIRHSEHDLVVTSGNRFTAFRDGVKKEVEIPDAPVEEKNGDKKKDKSKDGTQQTINNWILASVFSNSGDFFAVCDDQKQLHLYRTSPEWQLLSSRNIKSVKQLGSKIGPMFYHNMGKTKILESVTDPGPAEEVWKGPLCCLSYSNRFVPRRGTAVTFTNCESHVIVADRSGDVYRFSTKESNKEGQLLQGHLSMLLDVAITKDDKYIVTCDRDEKIRVSHYPNAYNIHTFCLGHTEFVSQLLYVEKLDCLLSGSGDGTICLWNLNGNLLHCVHCKTRLDDRKGQTEGSTNGKVESEVKGQGDGDRNNTSEDNIAAVKRMVYDEQQNILAVIYFNSPCVSFYSICTSDNRMVLEELDPTLDTSSYKELWDISFDLEHRFWLLEANENQTVHVFRCTKDSSKLQLTDVSQEDNISSQVNVLNSSWEFFSASESAPTLYSVLQKTKYDNMKLYMEKKHERIGGKKLKQIDEKQEPVCEPDLKKAKVS